MYLWMEKYIELNINIYIYIINEEVDGEGGKSKIVKGEDKKE